jgi:hypothetical protein
MIQVDYTPANYHLTVTGHAGYGPRGKDIVCAGVSALTGALVMALDCHGIQAETDAEDGDMDVLAKPFRAQQILCRTVFETIMAGLELIATQYPEHIHITVY